jgi:hypothetical protein
VPAPFALITAQALLKLRVRRRDVVNTAFTFRAAQ